VLRLPFCTNKKKTATEKRVITRTARRGSWLTTDAATSWMARVMAMRWAISSKRVTNERMVLPCSTVFSVWKCLNNRLNTLGMTDKSTAIANTMMMSSSSLSPDSSAASLSSSAIVNDTENETSLPRAFNAIVADMQCEHSVAFTNRQKHYIQHIELAYARSAMTLRGLFVTGHGKRLHRKHGSGVLIYGMVIDDIIQSFSTFGISQRRIYCELLKLVDKSNLHQLTIGQRKTISGTWKRGVRASIACWVSIALMKTFVPYMMSPCVETSIRDSFYEKISIVLDRVQHERNEWQTAVMNEVNGFEQLFSLTSISQLQ